MAKKKSNQAAIYIWMAVLLAIILVLIASIYTMTLQERSMGKVIATVNGQQITQSQLDEQYSLLPLQYQLFITKADLLQRMVDNILVEQAAAKANVSAEPELPVVIRELERPMTDAEFRSGLAAEGLTYSQYESLIAKRIITEKYLRMVLPGLDPSNASIDQEYQQFKHTWDTPHYRARQIIVNSSADAERIRAMVNGSTSFSDLAAEYSIDPAAKQDGGDLGWFMAKDMLPELQAPLEAMKPGEVSEPIKTQYGYHLLYLEDVRSGMNETEEEIRPYLVFELVPTLVQKESKEYSAYLQRLRANATIDIIDNETGNSTPPTMEIGSAQDLNNVISTLTNATGGNAAPGNASGANAAGVNTTDANMTAPMGNATGACNESVYFVMIPGPASDATEGVVDSLISEGLPIVKATPLTIGKYVCVSDNATAYPQLTCPKTGQTVTGKENESQARAFVAACLG